MLVGDLVIVTEVVGETLIVLLGLVEAVPLGLTDIVLLLDTVADHEKDACAEAEGDPEAVLETVGVTEVDRVTVAVTLEVPDLLCVGDTLIVLLGDVDGVPVELTDIVLDGELVADQVKEALAEADEDPVGDLVIVPVADTDRVTVGVILTVAEALLDGEPVPVTLTDIVRVGDVVADHV